MEKLTECPLCGSKDIQYMTQDMQRKFQGTPYAARGIEVLLCSNCDEEFVTAEMQERIESFRPEVKEKAQEEV